MAEKILVVEDEKKIARVLQLEFEYEGYEAQVVHDGIEAWELMQQSAFDLYILDVMLPGLSGIELLRRLRKEGKEEPVLMLTARDATVDKVTGLDQGADDYMTKPFDMEELFARVRVLLRRKGKNSTGVSQETELAFADLQVNMERREAKRAGQLLDLTPREFDLLVCFIEHPYHVLSREQLMEQVWGFDYAGETNVVDVYIRYLRQKLDKPFEAAYLQTVRGVGYVLKDAET
ncbi:response regulator transcription factor [Alkalicoccus daliensis]|uniref:Transcriptional regulatory protein, C terminal n=1 Tax=Alkalicoccus daliensis TaxID=745820 RepID=A0A1H0IT21_9BACI|nr:response regulator transcription factor [Alkalicoccus daliensis]SDO34579.1 Transcriptional regulatory protein, C terminal [Alkalicoccus daliensis]